ncbi:hypothetical protein PGB90_001332 [Kerria lacca]
MADIVSTDSTSGNNSYASRVKRLHHIMKFRNPEDEQAFVFDCISDIKAKQYLHAMNNVVGGLKNIIAVSKIENNQMVVYLISKEVQSSIATSKTLCD